MYIQTLLKGMGIGAGLMYLWDPISGRQRRSRVQDQWDHAVHCTQDYLEKAQRDAGNRATGLGAQAYSLVRRDDADDRVITARVRSKLGRYSSHPHAIDVDTHQGYVVLSGPTLEAEVGDLLKAVCSVAGVRGVENQLEVYSQRGNIAALQGGQRPTGERSFDFLEDNWSPATRVAAQLAGATLVGNCMSSRSLASTVLGMVGLGLFVRASTNRSLGQLFGTEAHPEAVRFQRTVTIHAPVEKVWDFLSDFEEVGRFLPIVKSVQRLGGDHYRWELNLPGGHALEIEERVTERVPEQRLSWESVTDHPISYCGTVSLQSEGADSTRVHIRFDYTPPGGRLGAALASMFGVDAKSKFQEAVMRIKPFLETGKPPHDLHEVSSGHRIKESQASTQGPARQTDQQPSKPVSAPAQRTETGQPQRPSLSQTAQAQPDQPPSGQLPPVQIPSVHAEVQPSPNQPERGRLG